MLIFVVSRNEPFEPVDHIVYGYFTSLEAAEAAIVELKAKVERGTLHPANGEFKIDDYPVDELLC